MTRKIYGFVDSQGYFKPYDKAIMVNAFAELKGKRVEIELRPETKQRSIFQNKWYWGEAVPKILHFFKGKAEKEQAKKLTSDDVHEWLKKQFAGIKIIKIGREEFSRPRSTTELSTIEFNEFMEKIQRYFAQFDVIINDPHQEDFTDE